MTIAETKRSAADCRTVIPLRVAPLSPRDSDTHDHRHAIISANAAVRRHFGDGQVHLETVKIFCCHRIAREIVQPIEQVDKEGRHLPRRTGPAYQLRCRMRFSAHSTSL